jgi:hypothetical protein
VASLRVMTWNVHDLFEPGSEDVVRLARLSTRLLCNRHDIAPLPADLAPVQNGDPA